MPAAAEPGLGYTSKKVNDIIARDCRSGSDLADEIETVFSNLARVKGDNLGLRADQRKLVAAEARANEAEGQLERLRRRLLQRGQPAQPVHDIALGLDID